MGGHSGLLSSNAPTDAFKRPLRHDDMSRVCWAKFRPHEAVKYRNYWLPEAIDFAFNGRRAHWRAIA